MQMQRGMRIIDFVVMTDRPTMPNPEGRVNAHGEIAHVPACDCPKVVRRFQTRAEADAFAAVTPHAVVLPRQG